MQQTIVNNMFFILYLKNYISFLQYYFSTQFAQT